MESLIPIGKGLFIDSSTVLTSDRMNIIIVDHSQLGRLMLWMMLCNLSRVFYLSSMTNWRTIRGLISSSWLKVLEATLALLMWGFHAIYYLQERERSLFSH